MKHYSPTGRRKHGRPLKRLLDTWDRNGSTSGLTAWQIYDDDDDDDDLDKLYTEKVNTRKWEGCARFNIPKDDDSKYCEVYLFLRWK